MINFLRKTRKQLAADNNFKKYARCAFGEIVLVVIGILIALQINNWNINKNNDAKLIKSYELLLQSLEKDLIALEEVIETHSGATISAQFLQSHLLEKKSWTDSLINEFIKVYSFKLFSQQTAVFETIKLNGFELIENAELKQQLFVVYQEYAKIYSVSEESLINTNEDFFNNWFSQNFNLGTNYKPSNYNQILNDHKYHGNLGFQAIRQQIHLENANYFSLITRSLIEQLKIEKESLLEGKKLKKKEQKKLYKFKLFGYLQADSVVLSGDFNSWNNTLLMRSLKDGWEIEIEVETGKYYQYKFIVDGVWIHDTLNPIKYPNGQEYESYNSAIYVPY